MQLMGLLLPWLTRRYGILYKGAQTSQIADMLPVEMIACRSSENAYGYQSNR